MDFKIGKGKSVFDFSNHMFGSEHEVLSQFDGQDFHILIKDGGEDILRVIFKFCVYQSFCRGTTVSISKFLADIKYPNNELIMYSESESADAYNKYYSSIIGGGGELNLRQYGVFFSDERISFNVISKDFSIETLTL